MAGSKLALAGAMLLGLISAGAAAGLPNWYNCNSGVCASSSPPGGLTADQVPQFVLLTHDDAINAVSNTVVRSISDPHTNPNGCNVPVTWYTLQNGTYCDLVNGLYNDNHEIALHTVHHVPLRDPFSDAPFNLTLEEEIMGVRTWLNQSCNIPLEDMVGFRSPYLVHNPPVREVLFKNGLLYDSSMIEHWPSQTSPSSGQKLWPYSMDAGIPQDCNYTAPDGWCTEQERYPGMFEVPMWQIEDSQGTGLYSMDPGGDVYSNVKLNFDFSYNGNKAPFGLFFHAPWLTSDNVAAVNKFIEYALGKGDVWFVTNRQLIEWMKNPVPKDQMASWFKCKSVNLTTPSCQTYTVKSGDSLYAISQSTGAAIQDILTTNPSLGTGANLVVGQVLRIPPYPASCAGGSSSSSSSSSSTATPSPPAAGAPCQMATVGAGDTLGTIIDKYRTTLASLLAVNPGLTSDSLLNVGQKIKIPPYPDTCVNGQLPSAPAPAPTMGPVAAPAMNSGLNVTLTLQGMSKSAFDSDGLPMFKQALAKLLSMDPTAIQVVRTYALGARRRLQQAGGTLGVDMSIPSSTPMDLYNTAVSALSVGGPLDQATAAFGVSQASPAVLTPYANGTALAVPSAAAPVPAPAPATAHSTPRAPSTSTTAGTSSGGSSSSSTLSTGAIVGIAVGGAALLALAAGLAVYLSRRNKTQQQQRHQYQQPQAAGVQATVSTDAAPGKSPRSDMA